METLENENFVVRFRDNGELEIQSKKTSAKATICAIPSGLVVAGGGERCSGDILSAFGEDNTLLVLDRLKLYW
ncbi:hypothetical protein KW796_02855 [Candidatus Parcubacteria bacterium]|nr:hypothetical protein [Candidatus Parcubacteria bacterium]